MLLTNNYYHITNKVYKFISEGNLSPRERDEPRAISMLVTIGINSSSQNARTFFFQDFSRYALLVLTRYRIISRGSEILHSVKRFDESEKS